MTLTSVPCITTYFLSWAWPAFQSLTPMLTCITPPPGSSERSVCTMSQGAGLYLVPPPSDTITVKTKSAMWKPSPFPLPPFGMHCSNCKYKAAISKHELVQKTRHKTKKMNMTWHSMKPRAVNREIGMETGTRWRLDINIHDIREPRNQTSGISFIALCSHTHYGMTINGWFSSGTFKTL